MNVNTSENYGRFKAVMTPEKLRSLYRRLTDEEIGDEYGVTGLTVSQYRRKWGIKTITGRQRRDLLRKQRELPTLDDLTPVRLKMLYERMGDRQIAKMHGVTKPTIKRLREKWGIASISKSERATSREGLTEEQMETILGVMLGDGHLLERGVFSLNHSHAQFGYIQHLHRILSPIARPLRFEERTMDSGTVAYVFSFRTVQHVWLKWLRDEVFYPEGVRIFPEGVLRDLSPRSLAYWYFDDGHLDSGLPSFALGDVTDEMAEDVVRWTGERFKLETYLRPQSTDTCKQMGIRASSTDRFFKLIVPFLVPALCHKVPPAYWPSGIAPDRPVLTREPTPLPRAVIARARAWETLEADEQEAVVEEFAAFWREAGFPYPTARVEELDILHHLAADQVLRDGGLKGLGVGQSICHEMMPHIWDTQVHGGKYTAREVFEDDEAFRRTIRMVLSMGDVPHPSRVRSAVRLFRSSGVYNFRPSASKVLVDRYCPEGGTVFDPCGGWGGRMLGALMATSVPRYIACEPQPQTQEGLLKLRDWVAEYIPGVAGRAEVHRVPAEDFEFPEGVDVVMTSPPYWCKERYGEGEGLAGNRYPTYEAWLLGFWEPVMRKAVEALLPGGWLVLNVDDVIIDRTFYPLCEDTLEIARGLGLGEPSERFRYEAGRPGKQDNHEWVFCWAKGPMGRLQPVIPSLTMERCGTCGRPVRVGEESCPRCAKVAEATVECKECGTRFVPKRRTARFCTEACGARFRRREKRKANPPKKVREFKCVGCGEMFETAKKGRFLWCPACREGRDVEKRTKVCAYRECGREFLDGSAKSSMKFCCAEHRRREKLFRTGKVTDVSAFRKPDPVLG